MSAYQLLIAPSAQNDLRAIVRYISDELKEPETAQRQYFRIKEAILGLNEMPERYAIAKDGPLALLRIRKIPVDHYLVFFTVDHERQAVKVIRVLYGKREWESLL